MLIRSSAALLALAAMLAVPSTSSAQNRDIYRLPLPAAPDMAAATTGRSQPGVAASSPIGFGPGKGDVFAGFGYQASTAIGNNSDGSLSAGMGFFNSQEMGGLEVVLTSLSTVRSGFGSRMVMGLKGHKAFTGNVGVGVGIEGIKINGENDTKPSIYVVGTTVVPMRAGASTFNQATLNFGIGTGRFQPIDNFLAGDSGMGLFLGAAVRVNWFSSAIVDYSGGMVNLAASFTPSKNLPLVITPSFSDVGGAAPGGSAGRFSLGAGFSWKY